MCLKTKVQDFALVATARCRIRDLDVGCISVVTSGKLSRICAEPEFNIVSVGKVSRAAKSLCWWVLSVQELLKVAREGDLKLARTKEGEERLANTDAYIRK